MIVSQQLDEKAIFNVARKIDEPDARLEYLEQVCGNDAILRERVLTLLSSYQEEESFLELSAATVGLRVPPAATLDPPVERSGTPYKLLEQIGEGGMGIVYVAEQQLPVRRLVALKLVKPGMDSKQVIARFEAERQALAMMDHPNIAKFHDAGTTEAGRPYFVMELVRGITINEFCDQQKLTVRQRLELFIQVCQAVQHAHQKGIIHRDLKPTNVLVTLADTVPVPKIIDFGIAKALGGSLTENTLHTDFAQFIGTPLYMSPEQAELNQFGVDTRSDVYSLGVLLYELLTATTPFEKDRLKSAGIDEMRRIIREEEPETVSARIARTRREGSAFGVQRSGRRGKETGVMSPNLILHPSAFRLHPFQELDWIVARTLEKDRSRRYESASALAADIQRYLADEPVQACPPSALYRIRKFTRRNRGPVFATALVLLALVGGIVGISVGLVRAEQARRAEVEQRQLAQANERKAVAAAVAEKQAKDLAQEREREIAAVLSFVENKILAAARPEGAEGGLGWDVTLHQAIDAALPYLDTNFKQQPLIEARLRQTVGTSFFFSGNGNKAVEQLEKARELYERHRGLDHPDTLLALNELARSLHRAGRNDEAVRVGEQALPLRRTVLGPDHPETLEGMHNLAYHYNFVRRYDDAVKLGEETLALRKARFGPEGRQTLETMGVLAICYFNAGRHDEAIRLHEHTLALKTEKFGRDTVPTLFTMFQLAHAYAAVGRHAEALKLSEEAFLHRKRTRGPDHLVTRDNRSQLLDIYRALGKFDEIIALREETFNDRKARLGPGDPQTLVSMDELARELANCPDLALRDTARAISLARHAVEHLPSSPASGHAWNTLTEAHYRAGDYQAAVATAEHNSRLPYARFVGAMAQFQLGNSAQARSWYEEAAELMAAQGAKDPELPRVRAECESVLSISNTP